MQQQQGAQYMQQQGHQMTQQQLMAARSSLLYSQQPFSGLQQLGVSGSSGLHMLQQQQQSEGCSNVNVGGSSSSSGAMGGFPDFVRAGEGLHGGGGRSLLGGSSSKHDIGMGSGEGRGNGGDGGENLYLKSSDDNAN